MLTLIVRDKRISARADELNCVVREELFLISRRHSPIVFPLPPYSDQPFRIACLERALPHLSILRRRCRSTWKSVRHTPDIILFIAVVT